MEEFLTSSFAVKLKELTLDFIFPTLKGPELDWTSERISDLKLTMKTTFK